MIFLKFFLKFSEQDPHKEAAVNDHAENNYQRESSTGYTVKKNVLKFRVKLLFLLLLA
jgi:hypothetical protein